MNMTHYMELLADNQPWNLLIFMAIPVILAETMAITELYILFTRRLNGVVHQINRGRKRYQSLSCSDRQGDREPVRRNA